MALRIMAPPGGGHRRGRSPGAVVRSGSIDGLWLSVASIFAASPAADASWRSCCPRRSTNRTGPRRTVAAIIAEVRAGGDAALRRLTARFDGVEIDELRVPEEEIQAALARVPAALQDALDVAHDRILAYHAHEAAATGSG